MAPDKLRDKIVQELGKNNPVTSEILRDIDLEINKNPVTGMPDGRQLNLDLEEIVEDSRRREERNPNEDKTYVLMIDIDYFGRFNKDYGEETGNKVLKAVNEIITKTLRDSDLLEFKHQKCPEYKRGHDEDHKFAHSYHIHGEEMVAIYKSRGLQDAKNVGERIRSQVEKESREQTGHRVTVTLGLTEFLVGKENYQEAQARADEYSQFAKKEGRNRIYFGGERTENENYSDRLYLFKKNHLYRPGRSDAVAALIADAVRSFKGRIGKTLTKLYSLME